MVVVVYASLEVLKARLGLGANDHRDDEGLESILSAVSRAIDVECRTQFYASDQTRWFTARCNDELLVDDLLSITSLQTDLASDGTYSTTWAVTDYMLAPYNAPLESVPRPYWKIESARSGANAFPVGVRRGVKIAGSWGFSAVVPKLVETICLRESLYRFQSDRTPYGMTTGDGQTATVPTIRLSDHSRRDLVEFKRVVMA